jgi:hypothetical protein
MLVVARLAGTTTGVASYDPVQSQALEIEPEWAVGRHSRERLTVGRDIVRVLSRIGDYLR